MVKFSSNKDGNFLQTVLWNLDVSYDFQRSRMQLLLKQSVGLFAILYIKTIQNWDTKPRGVFSTMSNKLFDGTFCDHCSNSITDVKQGPKFCNWSNYTRGKNSNFSYRK